MIQNTETQRFYFIDLQSVSLCLCVLFPNYATPPLPLSDIGLSKAADSLPPVG